MYTYTETSLAANIFDCYNLLSSQKWRIDTRRNVISSKVYRRSRINIIYN